MPRSSFKLARMMYRYMKKYDKDKEFAKKVDVAVKQKYPNMDFENINPKENTLNMNDYNNFIDICMQIDRDLE